MFIDQSHDEIDSPQFREYTLPKVKEELNSSKTRIDKAILTKNPLQITEVVITTSEELNKVVTDTKSSEAVPATQDTAIMHALGVPIWLRPENAKSTEVSNLTELATRFKNDEIDRSRLAQGVYMSEVLYHKYKNGNGRVARGLLEVVGSENGQTVTAEETKKVLGIGREALTQTGKDSFRINVNPDYERMVLGIAYYAVEKCGLTVDEVVDELQLNQKIPEQSLETLANRLGKKGSEVKDGFIHYMVVQSELQWCKF